MLLIAEAPVGINALGEGEPFGYARIIPTPLADAFGEALPFHREQRRMQ